MNDQDFQDLATLYLESRINDGELDLLNRELASSPRRVGQFNDLRLLAGLLHEHGRGDAAPDKVIEMPGRTRPRSLASFWASKAALLVGGVLIGSMGTGLLWALNAPEFRPLKLIPLPVFDAGFESNSAGELLGGPDNPGVWIGDQVEVVESGHQGVASFEGARMLRFKQTWGKVPQDARESNLAQIVDLRGTDRGGDPAWATLRARFNRIDAGPETDTRFRLQIIAMEGAPSTFSAQIKAGQYLSRTTVNEVTDADPTTWETEQVIALVPPEADYLVIGVAANEDVHDNPAEELEFAGHYVDGVELTLSHQAPETLKKP